MKLINQPVIVLTEEETEIMKKAADIFSEIGKSLEYNHANGFTAFQEGIIAPESFWIIYRACTKIERKELIP